MRIRSSTRMRAAIIVNEFPFGGAERQAILYAQELSRRGFSVSILALKNKESMDIGCVNIQGLGLRKSRATNLLGKILSNLKIYGKLRNELKGRYDVVISFAQLYGIALCGKSLAKVLSLRIFHPESINFSRGIFLKRIDLVTCNSLPQYSLMNAKGCRAMLINNIVSVSKDYQGAALSTGGQFILVSNISQRKNIEMAVNAFILLENKSIHLKIIGRTSEKSYSAELMKMIDNANNVEYLGFLDSGELESVYYQSEGLIHPSRREGTSNAILDAMRYRIPAIVSRIPENIALVENVRDFLFDPDSPEELAERVTRLHSNLLADPHFYDEYLDLQEKKIKLVYSQDSIEELVTAIEELVKRKNL
ncbi:glycosyltransferase family 4 protein [Mesotoga sp. H07.pep.5.3]|uniref:glycosyltransferase family 4 protein n=1 Tax=Mesotoga sp. H07.pep.5.3 TaxID=1421003 RepID=UPI000C4D85DE|nr:glycosyltransferase family 4 protein [Mesotoga sp. H07.pep.5.3]PIJ63023.1 hypothetical protein V513_02680 [Mesotoga sp. H07.pep.5.3]